MQRLDYQNAKAKLFFNPAPEIFSPNSRRATGHYPRVIRVAITAHNGHVAEEIAAALAVEERLELVEIRISPRLLSRPPPCDVLLAIAPAEFQMPPDGPPVVLLSDASFSALPGLHAPNAVLSIAARTEELVAALLAAATGLYVLTADQAALMARARPLHQPIAIRPEKLTVRELEVLRMLADGLANKESPVLSAFQVTPSSSMCRKF